MYLLKIICVLLALTAPTQAQTSDPDFQTAVEAWLQDNDAVALPLLSKLAKAGNEDAMILLGVLERLPGELSPYLDALELKERRLLLRVPGGLSGRSWLTKVVDQELFAQAILNSRRKENRVQAVSYLLNYNEQALTISPLRALNSTDKWDVISGLMKHRNFPPQLWILMLDAVPYERNFAYPEAAIVRWMKEISMKTIQSYLFSYLMVDNMHLRGMDIQRHIGRILFSGEAAVYREGAFDRSGKKKTHPALRREFYQAAAGVLVKDEFVEPVLQLCQKKCPQDVNKCTRAVYSMIGGYRGLLDVHTPIERYISNNLFLKSPRFAAQLSRQSTHLGVGWHIRKPISLCANKIIECRWKWCNR